MVFLVASHMTNPNGQLPDEDREIRLQRLKVAKKQTNKQIGKKKQSSSYRFIQSLIFITTG